MYIRIDECVYIYIQACMYISMHTYKVYKRTNGCILTFFFQRGRIVGLLKIRHDALSALRARTDKGLMRRHAFEYAWELDNWIFTLILILLFASWHLSSLRTRTHARNMQFMKTKYVSKVTVKVGVCEGIQQGPDVAGCTCVLQDVACHVLTWYTLTWFMRLYPAPIGPLRPAFHGGFENTSQNAWKAPFTTFLLMLADVMILMAMTNRFV